MTIDTRQPSLILPVAVVALLLLSGDVGSYYAMVVPAIYEGDRIPVYLIFAGETGVDTINLTPTWIARAFTPIHWLDRRIRPHVWEPSEK